MLQPRRCTLGKKPQAAHNSITFGTHPVSAPHTHTTSAEPHLKEANTLYTHTTSVEPHLKEANTLYTHTTSAEPHLKEANTLYTHTTSAEPHLKEANTLYSDVFFQSTSLLRKHSLLDVKYDQVLPSGSARGEATRA